MVTDTVGVEATMGTVRVVTGILKFVPVITVRDFPAEGPIAGDIPLMVGVAMHQLYHLRRTLTSIIKERYTPDRKGDISWK
uniref:Uncharacterized protein n=1 Tax=viral metagenome TaxID=1070528 RepID=A0A6M3XYS2_9ZZZZ